MLEIDHPCLYFIPKTVRSLHPKVESLMSEIDNCSGHTEELKKCCTKPRAGKPAYLPFSLGRELAHATAGETAMEFPTTKHFSEAKERVDFQLQVELVDQLQELASDEDSTLSCLILTAFLAVFYRYGGTDNNAANCQEFRRKNARAAQLNWAFKGALSQLGLLEFTGTFRQLLQQVTQSQRNGLKFENVPFDLSLEFLESSREIGGCLVYRSELWENAMVLQFKGHFITLLEAIAADADQPLLSLPLLTESERHQLLIEWNDTTADFPRDKCVQELFQEQVERTPDAIAVVLDDRQLTYREINQRANQLAYYLRSLGGAPICWWDFAWSGHQNW